MVSSNEFLKKKLFTRWKLRAHRYKNITMDLVCKTSQKNALTQNIHMKQNEKVGEHCIAELDASSDRSIIRVPPRATIPGFEIIIHCIVVATSVVLIIISVTAFLVVVVMITIIQPLVLMSILLENTKSTKLLMLWSVVKHNYKCYC